MRILYYELAWLGHWATTLGPVTIGAACKFLGEQEVKAFHPQSLGNLTSGYSPDAMIDPA